MKNDNDAAGRVVWSNGLIQALHGFKIGHAPTPPPQPSVTFSLCKFLCSIITTAPSVRLIKLIIIIKWEYLS